MKKHVKAVGDALRARTPAFLPRGELFITQGFLDFYFPAALGDLPEQVSHAVRAMGLSLVGFDLNEGSPDAPHALEGANRIDDCFVVGYINGPVSRLIDSHGFNGAMVSMKREPALFSEARDGLLRYVERTAKAVRAGGFAGIALADDIAGNRGLLFSFDYFVNTVWPVYRTAAEIIKGEGLAAFFHSDGDMRKTIEFLIQAGYDCIHPVDVQGGLDVYSLREEFGDKVAFMGNIDVMGWDAERIASEIGRAERTFEKGGLILGSMGGISRDVGQEALRALYPDIEGGPINHQRREVLT